VQLSGGNDGLNTVIPYEDDVYHRSRPTLALSKGEVLALPEGQGRRLGFHPRMGAFRDLYEEGLMALIPGVGYPNPSRSHFRSMDVWHSARPDEIATGNGWLGRSLELRRDELSGLFLGDGRLPLALTGEVPVPSLQNMDFLEMLSTDRGRRLRKMLKDLNQRERDGAPEAVRRLAVGTVTQLEKMVEIGARDVREDYPSSDLGWRLKLTGQLIAGGFPSRVYYLTQGGYDTHAYQKEDHGRLLSELSDSVGAFFRHLTEASMESRVTVLIFSEFGRRVKENGSLGTDHGIAQPVVVLSGGAKAGVHGAYPSLRDLDEGYLRYSIDFRCIYAALLEDVLGLESERILGGTFEKLEIL